jgi:hypothetical protein
MIDRASIELRFRKKQTEIASLEERLRAAKAYLTALNDILKMDNAGEEADASEAKLRPGSAVAQARDIIQERGGPVHIDELLRAMGKEVTRDSKASLAGSLAAYVRREEIFSRPAPNTYGLIELGHRTPDDLNYEVAPPEHFGRSPDSRPVTAPDFDDDVPF